MNPKFEKASARLAELIEEGRHCASLERTDHMGSTYIEDRLPLGAWLVKVENITKNVFGVESAHYTQLKKLVDRGVHDACRVNEISGVLTGAKNDLDGGYLAHQEQLVAGVVFDSVLEQARELLKVGYKDPAAVLGRVVAEETLRRLCRAAGLPDKGKASMLNDSLHSANRYNKPQWRLIQSWLDIGNSAAHGKFTDYDENAVARMIEDIERLIAAELN